MRLAAKKALVAAFFLPVLTGNTAHAADPFVPDTTPRCSVAIQRGAQNALDSYLGKVKAELQEEEWELRKKMYEASSKGESTVGIRTEMDLKESTDRFKYKKAAINKTAELQQFSLKKYKCLAEPIYFAP